MTGGNKRFPILLWGDLVEGAPPVLRRALAGYRAHECMYAWVYLTDWLALKRLYDLVPTLPAERRREFFESLDGGIWQHLDRRTVDPNYQMSRSAFEAAACMACLAAQAGEAAPVLVELGSTFFASKTKFDIVELLARERFADWPRVEPRWVGIDNSPFMHDTARALHGGERVELLTDYGALARPERFAVILSRFVASYAFPGGGAFAGYVAERFPAILVEDAYSTTGRDVPVYNHGQAEVFFGVPETLGALERAGYEIHLFESYPDFPAGAAPCHVIRYLAARKGVFGEKARSLLSGLGFAPPELVAAGPLLDRLNGAVSPRRWLAVEKAKRRSPVWGPTPDVDGAPARNRLVLAMKELVRPFLVHRRWRRYRMRGPMAVSEIHRALDDEKL